MSTVQRGYDAKHRRLRERYRASVEAGRAVCPRCGMIIEPGQAWDLGHDDHDRTQYNGPEHAFCNRQAGGRRGGKVRARKARRRVWSREWLR